MYIINDISCIFCNVNLKQDKINMIALNDKYCAFNTTVLFKYPLMYGSLKSQSYIRINNPLLIIDTISKILVQVGMKIFF